MGGLDAQMIKQRQRIVRHGGRVIIFGIVAFGRVAMAAVVDGDGPVSGLVQRRYPARRFPVDAGIGGKPMNEQHRLARPVVDIGQIKTVMMKMLH